jgi:hypothetical protein
MGTIVPLPPAPLRPYELCRGITVLKPYNNPNKHEILNVCRHFPFAVFKLRVKLTLTSSCASSLP